MAEATTRYHRARNSAVTAIARVIVAAACFFAGFVTHRITQEGYVREQATNRFREFLAVATDLGLIIVDHRRLDEIICTMSEAEWEDRDAAERAKKQNEQ